jgi:hypothetical protein
LRGQNEIGLRGQKQASFSDAAALQSSLP